MTGFINTTMEVTMKQQPFVIDVRPVRDEVITPEEYQKLLHSSPGLIERAQFIPPVIGKRDFGRFRVRYSRTRLKTAEA